MKKLDFYLEEIFRNIKNRRVSAGLSIERVVSDLQPIWKVSTGSLDPVRDLESLDYLNAITKVGHWHGGCLKDREEKKDGLTSIQRYSLRMSTLLDYLAYIQEEKEAIFSVLASFDPRIEYCDHSICPSEEVIQYLNGKNPQEKHFTGYKTRIKPMNFVY